MNHSFEITGGSVPGSTHVLSGRSNQDAFCWGRHEAGLVAVVCDGCGSSAHAGVGASLAARLIVAGAVALAPRGMAPAALLERVRADLVTRLRRLAVAMSVETPRERGTGAATAYGATAVEHFLFTAVGVLVDRRFTTTFAVGDGLIVVNGERRRLGPFAGNEPPYLGYDLLGGGRRQKIEVHPPIATAELESLLIGTDGVVDLDAAAERPLSGRSDSVGPLSQFWSDPRFFRNPDMVRRRLTVMNREPRAAVLPDDTTLVVLRRRRAVSS